MSASVWFEEVNIGLLQELKNTVKIKSASGDLVALEDKALIVRKPEEDFKLEVFPCISIYNKSYRHDKRRYNPAQVVVGRNNIDHQVVVEDPAVPFVLTYQIDFWARYQTDMDSMTRSWLMRHFHQFNLTVKDDGGVTRSCNCLSEGSVVKSDLVLNKERLFHSVINYQIWVELDDGIRYNKPMVTDRNIVVEPIRR